MNIEISATILQLLGAILVSIDAFTKRATYDKLKSATEAFIRSKFTSVSDFKKQRSKRLLFLFASVVILFWLSTLSLPYLIENSAALITEHLCISILSFVGVLFAWIFLYGMAAQAIIMSAKELPLLLKHYFGIFLLYSDRGPVYVIGFLSIVIGYSIQLYAQVSV
jgi:hypothetical protein